MIEIYTKDQCKFCVLAKDLLNSKGLKYVEYEINSEHTKQELLSRVPNAKTVPQIFIDNQPIGGYAELEKHLQKQG